MIKHKLKVVKDLVESSRELFLKADELSPRMLALRGEIDRVHRQSIAMAILAGMAVAFALSAYIYLIIFKC